MKSVKTRTVIWIILAVVAVVVIICASIIIHNANYILSISTQVEFDKSYMTTANIQKNFAAGMLAFALVILPIGIFIGYAGIKSWKYDPYEEA